jgi:hypothetical protein
VELGPDPLVPAFAGRNPDARLSGPTAGVAPLFGPLRCAGPEPFRPSAGRLGAAGWDPVEGPGLASLAWSASRRASSAFLGMRAVSSGSPTLVG